jgi:hypothetical protein
LRKFYFLFVLTLISLTGIAQNPLDKIRVDVRSELSLPDFLAQIEKQHPVRFFFLDEWFESTRIDSAYNEMTLRDALTNLLVGSEVTFTFEYNYAVFFVKDPSGVIERESLLRSATASRKQIISKEFGTPREYQAGRSLTLSGTLRDEVTGHSVENVSVWVNGKIVTTTDVNGYYRLTMLGGKYVIQFSHTGLAEKVIDLKIYRTAQLDLELEKAPVVLEEVVVTDQSVVNKRIGESVLKLTEMKRSPSFLGEVDVIKQIQTQPGVTTVGEVASGFNVRGGGVDQNLVLYDGIPVFNISHALGFFSAFNADAIGRVSFYRGGIPAEHGGRVSSVLDIRSAEGSPYKWSGGAGIGIISSRLNVSGPIKKDTTTVIASFRGSYSDWMLNTIKSRYQSLENSSVSFYDASVKFAHKFSHRTKVTLSGYTSFDKFSLSNDTLYGTRNVIGSVRLDHSFNDKLFGSMALGFGRYKYSMSEEEQAVAFDLHYGVTYPSLKLDFNYEGTHKLSFGLHNTLYNFEPGRISPATSESNARATTIADERSLETAIYFSDAFYIGEKIRIEAGLRYSFFNRLGSGIVYSYQQGKSMETYTVTDSTAFSSGDVMKTYSGPEPRLSFSYTLQSSASIKLGYNRMYQYMHLITNSTAVTPVDIWQSSNTYFKPQIADQISAGYFRNFRENMYEASGEVFYKTIKNILDFKEGARLLLNKNPETAFISGTGEAYGVEFSLTKTRGRLTGDVNYTYSRSWRKMNGVYDEERINDGERYPSNYDQPHVAQLNWRYAITRRYFFSGNFVYHTGRPVSMPSSGYVIDGVAVLEFAERNGHRLRDYHRLDIALVIEGSHKQKKLFDGTWVFSLYNVYARKNDYSIFYQTNSDGDLRPYSLSVVGTVIPSVSYSIKF